MSEIIKDTIIPVIILLVVLGILLQLDLKGQYKESCQKACKKEHTLWENKQIDDRDYCVCRNFDDELVLIKLAH